MTVKELKTRCKAEFKAKERGKWIASMVFVILALVHFAFIIVSCIITLTKGLIPIPTGLIFTLLLLAISGTISNKVHKTVKRYKKSGDYHSLPADYPYSLVYHGEPYPFDSYLTKAAPAAAPMTFAPPAAATVPAPAVAPVAVQPQQVTVTCGNCGQPMLIPMASGAFRITCPKCGNSFIHTN